jgi:hypothetical protein
MVGVLLTIVVVSLTDDGKALLEKALTPQDEDLAAGVRRLNNMRYVFSLLLSYWSWLKQETFWKSCGDAAAEKRADWAIHKMLAELIKLWPGAERNGWFKPKIHKQTHMPPDICRTGSPRNSYSGSVEHAHLTTKENARRTQMNRGVLNAQLGNHSAESYIINYAYDRACVAHAPVRDLLVPAASLLGGSKGTVTFARVPNRRIITSFQWQAATCTWPAPPEPALHAIRDTL